MVYVTRGGGGGGARGGRGAAAIPPDEAANAAAAAGGAGGSVTVYSNCQQVELFLNGQSLGSKPKPANDSPRTWTAAAGTLKAVGSNDGKSVATYELRPAGPAAKIALATDFGANLPHDYDDVAALQVTMPPEIPSPAPRRKSSSPSPGPARSRPSTMAPWTITSPSRAVRCAPPAANAPPSSAPPPIPGRSPSPPPPTAWPPARSR